MGTGTRIVFARHEVHKNNVLLPDAVERAKARGKALKEMGMTIDKVITSPQWRCVCTAEAILEGYGKMVPLSGTEKRLGDIPLDDQVPEEMKKALRQETKERYGDDSDANIAKYILEEGNKFQEHMIRRANEGAEALREIARKFEGQTILVSSHGVGRMEPSIRALQGHKGAAILEIMDMLIGRGGIVLLTIENEKLVSVETLNL